MGDPAPPPEEGGGGDTRLEWLSNRVVSTLKCKVDKFNDLHADEEGGMIEINDFLDSPSQRLFIWDDGKKLKASKDPADKFKKKSIYFVKLEEARIDAGKDVEKQVSPIACAFTIIFISPITLTLLSDHFHFNYFIAT
jgi:hypothetical protein